MFLLMLDVPVDRAGEQNESWDQYGYYFEDF
jgi:hypothetical protein